MFVARQEIQKRTVTVRLQRGPHVLNLLIDARLIFIARLVGPVFVDGDFGQSNFLIETLHLRIILRHLLVKQFRLNLLVFPKIRIVVRRELQAGPREFGLVTGDLGLQTVDLGFQLVYDGCRRRSGRELQATAPFRPAALPSHRCS